MPQIRTRARLIAGGASLLIAASAAVALVSPATAGPVSAPVASYTFDGDSGSTVVDSSGHGNDAAWKGTPAYVAGISGKAIAVSGGANYIKLPLVAAQTDASSSFSYEFWISEQSRTSYGPIVSNQDFATCNDTGLTLYNQATPGVLEGCWGKTSGGTKEYIHGGSGNIVGTWHHVAVVVDRTANTMTFYVDGVQTATSGAATITSSTALDSGLAFNIGGLSGSESDTSDGYTNAYIDDFEFFNVAIPGTQVAADYTASKPVVVSYTVAFDGNGATGGATASQSMISNQATALSANGFTRSGYQFTGWATSPSGPAVYADGQSVSSLSPTDGATVTLYAVWNRYRAPGDTIAPLLSYDFDADSGSTVTDSSGNGAAAHWSGTPSYGAGVEGKAAYVNSPDGSDRGVNFFSLPLIAGKTDGASSFSYVFWLNESSASSDSPIVSNQDFTYCYDKGTSLYNTSGQPGVLRACFGQDGTSTSQNYLPNVSTSSVIGTWHQVAVVADRAAGTMTTYLDGQQSVQNNGLTSAFTLMSGFPFRVGAEGSGTDTIDGFVNAYIDDFDFYAAPISAAQIENDYLATKPATPPTNDGSSLAAGFVSDTFRAPQVRAGGAVKQPLAALWNGGAVTSYTKVDGDGWLAVDGSGVVTGTAPATAPQDPATITVRATDGTTTSTITVEVPVIAAHDAPTLASATWNLWDAGSHVSDSTLKDLAVIAAHGLDVIGLQEDGGTGAVRLANALGWYGIEGDDGVGIVSAYPLDVASKRTLAGAAPAIGVTARVLGIDLRLWSVGLDGGAYGPEKACLAGVTDPAHLVTAEKATSRFAQAQAVAAALAPDVASAPRTPVVLLGDLESPSSTDWTAATASAHCKIGAVDWPVPDQLASAGLTDSFRAAHPDPAASAGTTWSPLVTTNAVDGGPEPQDRIDYVDFAGTRLAVLGSNTFVAGWPSAKDIQNGAWTSDHRGVVTTFRLDAPLPAPTATVASGTIAYQLGSRPSAAELLSKAGAASTTAGAVLAIDDSAVDYSTVGSYAASVTATDPADGRVSAPVTVTVKVVPVLTISLAHSTATVTLAPGRRLTVAEVRAAVRPSLNVTGTISVDVSGVDDAVAGSYPVIFTGTDAFGFTARARGTVTIAFSVGATDAPTPEASATPSATDAPASADPGSTAPPTSPASADPGSKLTGMEIGLPVVLAALLLVGALLVTVLVIARRRRASRVTAPPR